MDLDKVKNLTSSEITEKALEGAKKIRKETGCAGKV